MFIFRFSILLVPFVFLYGKMNAQLNADQEFVKKHGIRSALIKEKHYCGGVFLEYDTAGRLHSITAFTWVGSGYDYGNRHVTIYDSLGRYVSMRNYSVSDSSQIITPATSGRLTSSGYYYYPDESTIVIADTSWDDLGRMIRIEKTETSTTLQNLPPAGEIRSAFHADQIVNTRLEKWSKVEYLYSENTATVNSTILSGGTSVLEGKYTSGRINYFMRSSSYLQDSVTHVEINAWYTLNGTSDTSYSSYERRIGPVSDSTKFRQYPPVVNYGYVVSKKRMHKYHVRYYFPYYGTWQKLKSKEPWLHYHFYQYPAPPNWRIVRDLNYSQTIEEQQRQYHAKPVYTYWTNANR